MIKAFYNLVYLSSICNHSVIRAHGWAAFVWASAVITGLTGCGQKQGELFPPLDPPLAWPQGGEKARIQYVDQLRTQDDFKPGISGWGAFKQAVFGREGSGPGNFWLPSGIFIDTQNRIFIAGSYNKRVQVFSLLEGPGNNDN